MSKRAWRIDLGEDDCVADGGTSRERGSRLSQDEGEGLGGSDGEPVAAGTGLRLWWVSAVCKTWAAWAGFFGGGRIRFEESLHEFARKLGGARSAADIDAGLLRLAREMMPKRQVSLLRRPEEFADRPVAGLASDELGGQVDPPVSARGTWRCGTITEVPLRCGVATHGRLQVLTTKRGDSGPRPKALRRLAIACTMAACALENLRQHSDWAWKGVDEPRDDSQSRPNESHPAAVIRDATFLNAVLPFALGQAKRHHEPLSLLCLAIDRLGAIQDLLGSEASDCLVQEVCQVVGTSIRSSDIVARLDDDRIVVLLIRARCRSALHVAQMICRSVAEKTRNVVELGCATVSIGVAEFPGDARNAYSLLDAADDALVPRPGGGEEPGHAG